MGKGSCRVCIRDSVTARFRVEGAEAGDCDDGADNDEDGLIDCANT